MQRRHSPRCSSTLRGVAAGDAAADVGAEVAVGPAAQVAVELLHVHGQERLAQPLAGPVGERRDRVGASCRAAARRRPASGPRPRCATAPSASARAGTRTRGPRRRSRSPRRRCRGTARRGRTASRSSVVCSREPAPDLVHVQAAYGGEQVGAEREVGPAAALEHREHLRERLGDEVVGVAGGHQLAGQPPRGVDVPAEQLAVGVDVPAADGRDQLGVPGLAEAVERGAHTRSTTRKRKKITRTASWTSGRRPFPRRTTDQGGVGRGVLRNAVKTAPPAHPEARAELSADLLAALPPRFEAVGEALASGMGSVDACAVAGRELALDGVRSTRPSTGCWPPAAWSVGTEPDFGDARALAEAWSESTLEYLHRLTCEDPVTGLASLAHLQSRVSELYRGQLRTGPRRGSPTRSSWSRWPIRGGPVRSTPSRSPPTCAPPGSPRPPAPSSPAPRPSAAWAGTGSRCVTARDERLGPAGHAAAPDAVAGSRAVPGSGSRGCPPTEHRRRGPPRRARPPLKPPGVRRRAPVA